ITSCCSLSKLGAETETRCSPTGTFKMVAIPSGSVSAACFKSELVLSISTAALCTGRCCGSCTITFTVPNTEAHDEGEVTIAKKTTNTTSLRELIRNLAHSYPPDQVSASHLSREITGELVTVLSTSYVKLTRRSLT